MSLMFFGECTKIALHFTLRESRVATTLISSTSVARMRANLDACTGQTLSAAEEAAMGHVRDAIFAPKGTQSWEGVELAAYWETVGKLLMTQRLYAKK